MEDTQTVPFLVPLHCTARVSKEGERCAAAREEFDVGQEEGSTSEEAIDKLVAAIQDRVEV